MNDYLLFKALRVFPVMLLYSSSISLFSKEAGLDVSW